MINEIYKMPLEIDVIFLLVSLNCYLSVTYHLNRRSWQHSQIELSQLLPCTHPWRNQSKPRIFRRVYPEQL